MWDEPYLFKISVNGLILKCLAGEEARNITWHCHKSTYGGHQSWERNVAKLLQSDFWWPTFFKYCDLYVQECLECQKTCNISKRDKKPLNGTLEANPLIDGELTSWVPSHHLNLMFTFFYMWIM